MFGAEVRAGGELQLPLERRRPRAQSQISALPNAGCLFHVLAVSQRGCFGDWLGARERIQRTHGEFVERG